MNGARLHFKQFEDVGNSIRELNEMESGPIHFFGSTEGVKASQ